jgi:hypothetical protein
MICSDWMALSEQVRTDYAAFRLVELRTDDGVRFRNDPPTSQQIERMRSGMEAECQLETLDVAAVVRVSHDVYVAAAADEGLIS